VGARERMIHEFGDAPEEEQLRRLTEYNVLAQIEHLKSHPSVRERLLRDEIEIRGWVYDIGGGSIREADPQTGRFALLRAPE
jgi:carbonic anhydrase